MMCDCMQQPKMKLRILSGNTKTQGYDSVILKFLAIPEHTASQTIIWRTNISNTRSFDLRAETISQGIGLQLKDLHP